MHEAVASGEAVELATGLLVGLGSGVAVALADGLPVSVEAGRGAAPHAATEEPITVQKAVQNSRRGRPELLCT